MSRLLGMGNYGVGSSSDASAKTSSILTYSSNPTKAGDIEITLTYSSPIVGTPKISIAQQGSVSISEQDMTDSGDQTVWTYAYIVNEADSSDYIDGIATVTVTPVVDGNGNSTKTPINRSFTIDTAIPTSTITLVSDTPTDLNAVGYSILFNETVIGFDGTDITLLGTLSSVSTVTDLINNGSGQYVATVNVPADGEGTIGIQIGTEVTDLAGNLFAGVSSPLYTVSNGGADPIPVALSYSSDIASAGVLTITATYEDNMTTVPNISIAQQGSVDITSQAMTGATGQNIFTYNYTVVVKNGSTYIDGVATVSLSTVENASGGESLNPTNNTFTIDTTVPTASITLDNPSETDLNIVGFSVDFNETVTGFAIADITLGGTLSSNCSILSLSNSGNNYTVLVTVPSDGEGTVNISVGTGIDDLAGNSYAGDTSSNYTITQTPTVAEPLIVSMNLESDFTDIGSGGYSVTNNGVTFDADGAVFDGVSNFTIDMQTGNDMTMEFEMMHTQGGGEWYVFGKSGLTNGSDNFEFVRGGSNYQWYYRSSTGRAITYLDPALVLNEYAKLRYVIEERYDGGYTIYIYLNDVLQTTLDYSSSLFNDDGSGNAWVFGTSSAIAEKQVFKGKIRNLRVWNEAYAPLEEFGNPRTTVELTSQNPTTADTVYYSVTFDRDVVNFDSSNITLTGSLRDNSTLGTIVQNGRNFIIPVNVPAETEGDIAIDIAGGSTTDTNGYTYLGHLCRFYHINSDRLPFAPLGANVEVNRDYAFSQIFSDVIITARPPGTPLGASDKGCAVDQFGNPTEDFGMACMTDQTSAFDISGTYKLSCTVAQEPTVTLDLQTTGTVTNPVYSNGGFTCDLNITNTSGKLWFYMNNTNGGCTSLKVIRPSQTGTFTSYYKDHMSRFSVLRFMDFNHANNHTIDDWNDRRTINTLSHGEGYGSYPNVENKGVAYEYQIAMCNSFDSDMWVCIPHLADDYYVTQLATLIETTLNSHLKVHVEYSNETWNDQFGQTQWMRVIANEEPLKSELDFDGNTNSDYTGWRYSGKRTLEISNIFKTVFGASEFGERFNIVFNAQIGRYEFTRQCMLYIEHYGTGDVRDNVNVVAVAPYYNMGTHMEEEGLTVDDVIQYLDEGVDAQITNIIDYTTKAWNDYGLKTISYEGGTDTFGEGSLTAKGDAQYDARHKAIVERYLNAWWDISEALYGQGREQLFSWYFGGAGNFYTQFGTWGLTEDITNNDMPKIHGIDTVMSERFGRGETGATTTIPVNLTYSANPVGAGAMTITATYGEAVTTAPKISIDQQGTTDISAVAMTDSGDSIVFTYAYTVVADNTPTYLDGVATVSLSQVENAGGDLSANPTSATFLIDTIDPTATITLDDATPTSLAQVGFSVDFSEIVTGFTTADITLGGTLSGTSTIESVTSSDSLNYTVLVNIPLGSSGTINIIVGTGIIDQAGNAYAGDTSSNYTAVSTTYLEGVGSSVLLGTGATASDGWFNQLDDVTYDTSRDFTLINEGIGATTTQYWIDNYLTRTTGNGTEYDTTVIGLALGNEAGDGATKVSTLTTNYPILISAIRADRANYIVAQGNYVKAGANYSERQAMDRVMEQTFDLDYMFLATATDDLTGDYIPALDSGDKVHPNILGHAEMNHSVNYGVLGNLDSYDFPTVPNSVSNVDQAFTKVDRLTTNPVVITPDQLMTTWTFAMEMKSDDCSVGDVLWSHDQGSYTLKMFVDTDTIIKITDTVTTVSTGLTTTTIGSWKHITLRFNRYDSLICYIDGAESNGTGNGRINYPVLPTVDSIGKIVIGGLFDSATNDIDSFKFRNVKLWRAPLYESYIFDDSSALYTTKASQEYFNECTSIADITNKSQTGTAMTLNDTNITVVQDPVLSTLAIDMPLASDFTNNGSRSDWGVTNTGVTFSGTEAQFTGTEYFTIPSMVLETNFTIEFDWYYTGSFGTYNIFGKTGLTNGSDFINIQRTGGSTHKLLFDVSSGLNINVPLIGVSPSNTWYKIRMVVSNQDSYAMSLRYYVDETSQTDFNFADRSFNDDGTGTAWSFGDCLGITNTNKFQGNLKNLKIWTDAYDIGEEPASGGDITPPTVALTYSSDPADVGTQTITATYSEEVASTPLISINQQGSADIINVAMTDSGDSTIFTYAYTVTADNGAEYLDGLTTVSLSTVQDLAGNNSTAPTNNTFTIVTLDVTSPTVALTYSADPAPIGEMTITATYSEEVATIPNISINQQGTTDIATVAMTDSGNATTFTYPYTVVVADGTTYVDGTATVSLSLVDDLAGNTAEAPTNTTFEIDTSGTANPNLLVEMSLATDFTDTGSQGVTVSNNGVTFPDAYANFSGTDQWFEFTDLTLGEEFAIEFDWWRQGGFGTWDIFGKAGLTNGSADFNMQRTGGNTHKWSHSSSGGLTFTLSEGSLADQTWYKIRAVITASGTKSLTIRYYIDGVLNYTSALDDRTIDDDGTGTNWSFGRCLGGLTGADHEGKMRNLKIWNVAYDPGEE